MKHYLTAKLIKVFVALCMVPFVHLSAVMHIVEFGTSPWPSDPMTVEYDALMAFKNDPMEQEINYLAVPWFALLAKNKLATLPPLKFNGGFTVCQYFNYKHIIPLLKEMGIDTLFTPHATSECMCDGVLVLPMPHASPHGVPPAKIKDVYYSFIGTSKTSSLRIKLFRMAHAKDCVVKCRRFLDFYLPKEEREKNKREYQDILARSRFSLCPRGAGPGTLRFWESLQAGAIPILIADNLALPREINWDDCIVRIAEKDIETFPQVLKNISLEREAEMRVNCLQAYELCSGKNFVRTIRLRYEKQK